MSLFQLNKVYNPTKDQALIKKDIYLYLYYIYNLKKETDQIHHVSLLSFASNQLCFTQS